MTALWGKQGWQYLTASYIGRLPMPVRVLSLKAFMVLLMLVVVVVVLVVVPALAALGPLPVGWARTARRINA